MLSAAVLTPSPDGTDGGARGFNLFAHRALGRKRSPRLSIPVASVRGVALEQMHDAVHPGRERG